MHIASRWRESYQKLKDPSGNLEPSEDDLILTEQVKEALEFVGIRLYDHVIIAGEGDFSMRKNYWKG